MLNSIKSASVKSYLSISGDYISSTCAQALQIWLDQWEIWAFFHTRLQKISLRIMTDAKWLKHERRTFCFSVLSVIELLWIWNVILLVFEAIAPNGLPHFGFGSYSYIKFPTARPPKTVRYWLACPTAMFLCTAWKHWSVNIANSKTSRFVIGIQ